MRTLLFQLSMILLLVTNCAAYKGEQRVQAEGIIAESDHGGDYYPVLEVVTPHLICQN